MVCTLVNSIEGGSSWRC